MKRILIITLISLLLNCGYGNLDYVKQNAKPFLNESGFEILAYQGYEMGFVVPFTGYGGAYVWYNVKSHGDEKTIYQLALKRWGNEIHIYSMKAINAVSNK